MPIFDQGYQHWDGKLSGHTWRWWTITRTGVRAQLKKRWTLFFLLMSLFPALALSSVLTIWGFFEDKAAVATSILLIFGVFPDEQKAGPQQLLVGFWTIAFQFYFSIVVFFSMIDVLFIGPGLVSKDLRFNAMPLYFSRPLRRLDYFLGKFGIIAALLAVVAIVAPVIAWLLGVAFSRDVTVLGYTARILLGSVAYGAVIVISAGTLMLAISSLTRNSRYVGAMWIGIWIVSSMVSLALLLSIEKPWTATVSYTEDLTRTGAALLDTRSAYENFKFVLTDVPTGNTSYGNRPPLISQNAEERAKLREELRAEYSKTTYPWYYAGAVLAGLFGVSLWILSTRVKSMDRLK